MHLLLCLSLCRGACTICCVFRYGSTGPTGPAGAGSALSGVQVQLQGSSGGTILDGANVLFDVSLNSISPNVAYAAGTGIFTITVPGTYYINWWVNTDGAEAATNVEFTIETSAGGAISAVSPAPVVTTQLSGNALITVVVAPVTFALVNNSGATVTLGTSAVQADLTVVQVV